MLPEPDPFLKFMGALVRLTGRGKLTEGECRRVRHLWLNDPDLKPETVYQLHQQGDL